MKIAVYGGTGNIGSRIVAEAQRRGHQVTALSRHEPTTPLPATATWQHADMDAAPKVSSDHDVVISALGPSLEPNADPADFVVTVRQLTGAVGNTRFVVVGGAGSLLTAAGVRIIDTPEFPEAYKAAAGTQVEVWELLRAAGPELDWTYLSPAPEIGDGERTGQYRVADDTPAGDWISYADYAVALVDEIERPQHRNARFTVATR